MTIKDGDKPLDAQEVSLGKDGEVESATVFFNAGDAGVKSIGFSLGLMPGETNTANRSGPRPLEWLDQYGIDVYKRQP